MTIHCDPHQSGGRFVVSTLAIAAALFAADNLARAADWPQYRGPNQDGVSAERLTLAWPAAGPKVVWKTPTPNGFSSFAVSNGKVFTQVNREIQGKSQEIVVALDAKTGKELWFAEAGLGKYDGGGDDGTASNRGGNGPRSTPSVNVFGQFLVLYCYDETNGKPLWKRDLMAEHGGRQIGWKNAMSPVVDGNLVFVCGGGASQSLLALDKKTGEVVWKSYDETMTHATPVAATIQGVRQIIFFVKSGLLAVEPTSGKQLWRFPFDFNVSTAASPVVSGDIVYCSAGYGIGGGACRIAKSDSGFTATELYKIPGDKLIANHWSTPVCKDGYLYGMFSFKKYGEGPLKCVEIATGKIKWTQPGFGAGNVIIVNNQVVALADDGQLVLVEATPDAYKEISRAKILSGKCWSTPALSDGRIYARSTTEGVCVDACGK